MLKFFRKIRRNLLDEGNLKRYLIYAVGEILLVVIGILIALQINNWNENNKHSKVLSEVITEIREDLISDSLSISNLLKLRKEDYRVQQRVINSFEEKMPFNEQIKSDLGRVMIERPLFLVTNGFDLLKELNISSLKDKSLRTSLITYYQNTKLAIEKEVEDDKREFWNVMLPYIRHNFKEWIFGQYGIPYDYEKVQDDDYFLSSLKNNLVNCQGTISVLETGLESINNLCIQLDKKLDKK